MALPTDFNATIDKIQRYGIIAETPEQIRERLHQALVGVASLEGGNSIDMGPIDWAERLIRQFETAVHKEICDATKGCLNDKYAKLMDSALTPKAIESVSTAVLSIVAQINPAFAVSSVGIYIAIWLLKVGLNQWCSIASVTAK